MTPRPPAARSGGDIRCVILDRDGTLIRRVPYLHEPAGVELLPTVVEGLELLREAGCLLFMHTNQSGIGRGMFTVQDTEACNTMVVSKLGMGNDVFERICIAPERPDAEAMYRKPSPRFGREIIAAYGVGAHELCYVGDNISDLQTAERLGCLGIGVDTGDHELRSRQLERGLERLHPVFDTFVDAARGVLRGGGVTA